MTPAAQRPRNHDALPSSGVLHAAERLNAPVLEFLALATRELIHGGVHQTLVFRRDPALPSGPLAQLDKQVRLIEIERHGGWYWPFARAMRNELALRRYDAIHLHAGRAGVLTRLALGSLPEHPPLFYSPHGLSHPMAGTARQVFERLAGFSRCRPVGNGRGEARELERLTRRRAALVEDAVDAAFFEVETRPAAVPLVLTQVRERNMHAARAFAELAARFFFAGEPARFCWIGPDDAASAQVLRSANVEVSSPLDADSLRTRLGAAHVYVQTSYNGTRPLPLLQAMAVGLPCVLAETPLHGELVAHEFSGLLAPDVSTMAEHVKRLLDHPERARELGTAAQADARRRFHPRRFRQALLSLYQLGGEHPRAAGAALDSAAT